VLKTHRSDDPLSKSMFMVWPPMLMGARYSTSPCSGVAATVPLPPAVVFDAPVAALPPVDLGRPAEAVCDAFFPVPPAAPAFPVAALAFPAFAPPVRPLSKPSISAAIPPPPPPAALSATAVLSVSEPAAACIASRVSGRGTPNFLYAFTRALVPAPTALL